MTKEEIMQAVARGWCNEKNKDKTMDIDLAMAITDEIVLALDKSVLSDKGFINMGKTRKRRIPAFIKTVDGKRLNDKQMRKLAEFVSKQMKFIMVRLFGKKCVTVDSGYKLTAYFFKGIMYITGFKQING